ncbi:VOC family protein [Comamonas aquatica]|jgi:catechol 2,3-dioxygenase-like lactoylglutathione lyase family enzyme|uniref:Glyoxalase-like domain n=1 Tax=Comamonas aquatica TaxID=225991 RepID=A0AA35D5R2_9BURK|nr:VOC family protein [Comamonas aquatica]CAB5647758.1 Glyoxalase-like domain [Comamonas aquatica]CAB5674821.1 Glyoxalase-like domain [Comamonas aquatica]CAC9171195.1 Glyoxalase-like domain [Comamonas aquatica]CAC9680949.1 Glyoxalase-like domain [Comamonas aquatica]
MLSHILLGTNDLTASRQFYDAVLSVLGAPSASHIQVNGFERYVWDHDGTRLMIATPRDGQPCTHYNGFTLGFKTTSIEQLHRALDAALAHGGVAIEDPAGWRKAPGNDRYLAYVRDPAGHKLCLMFREIWAQPAPAGTTA